MKIAGQHLHIKRTVIRRHRETASRADPVHGTARLRIWTRARHSNVHLTYLGPEGPAHPGLPCRPRGGWTPKLPGESDCPSGGGG